MVDIYLYVKKVDLYWDILDNTWIYKYIGYTYTIQVVLITINILGCVFWKTRRVCVSGNLNSKI